MLHPKSLALAGGVFWGVFLMIWTWAAVSIGYGTGFLELLTQIYPGYTVTWIGSLIGLGYGFLDGFVGLYILAWLYNKFSV